MRPSSAFYLLIVAVILGIAASAQEPAPAPRAKITLPDSPGMQLVKTECARCHGLDNITSHKLDREGWENVVDRMVTLGARIPPEKSDEIVDYLATNFGKKKPVGEAKGDATSPGTKNVAAINVNKADAKELEVSLGLTEVQAKSLVSYRSKHGDFKSLADLERVPGIPAKKVEDRKGVLVF